MPLRVSIFAEHGEPSVAVPVFSALLPVLALLGASQAWAAPCGTWNPPVTAAPKAGIESKALTVSWTIGPPAACTNSAGDN